MTTITNQPKVSVWTREPVVIINVTVGVTEALIPVLVLFGVLQWTPEQLGAVMTLVIAVGGGLKTFIARERVTPVADPHITETKPREVNG